MNVIVKKIAGWCLDCGAVEESELEVVTYGLELILGTVIKYIFLLGIGCLFGRGLEIIIVLSLIAVFRTFAGGVHGRTSADCFGYMLLVCVLSVIFSERSIGQESTILPVLGYMLCVYAVLKYVPLQSLKNPICDMHKIRMKKLGAFIVVVASIFLFLTIGEGIKWIFLYPVIIESAAIVLASRKRRRSI